MLSFFKNIYRNLFPIRFLSIYDSRLPLKGRALVSYVPTRLSWTDDDVRFHGHSNFWESAEIVRILNRLGYEVDYISYRDNRFRPRKPYDIVIDIHNNLSKFCSSSSKKLFHATTSYLEYSNSAELLRLDSLWHRKKIRLKPRRVIKNLSRYKKNIDSADLISLIGNDITISTYPKKYHHKIRKIPVTSPILNGSRSLVSTQFTNDFLWFGGAGAVHKGLDLTMEVFNDIPNATLHIVGPVSNEKDFISAYKSEFSNKNVIFHGHLYPSSQKFKEIICGVRAFILPSCSEGTASSAIACMQLGILPIVSANVGIDIANDRGILLKNCTYATISDAVISIMNTDESELRRMSLNAMEYANTVYTRLNFTSHMTAVLTELIDCSGSADKR